jgi:hypothetical protein
VHLTARRNHARHKTRCGRDRLRNHTGRVDPIFLHTWRGRCLGRLRGGGAIMTRLWRPARSISLWRCMPCW